MKLRALIVCIAACAVLLIACTSDDGATTTLEPTATEALSNTETLTEDAYLADLSTWLKEGVRFSDEAIAIEDIASVNPSSSSNEVRALTLSINGAYWRDDALGFDAPAKYSEVQMWVERAAVTMADSLEDFWLGLSDSDVDLISSSTEKMGIANQYMTNANDALNALE